MSDTYRVFQGRNALWVWEQLALIDGIRVPIANSADTFPTEAEAEQGALRAGDGLSTALAALVDQMVNEARNQALLNLDSVAQSTLSFARQLNTIANGIGEIDRGL